MRCSHCNAILFEYREDRVHLFEDYAWIEDRRFCHLCVEWMFRKMLRKYPSNLEDLLKGRTKGND